MLEQISAITRHNDERISHVVVMGIGEPLDNFAELLLFIRMLSDEHGLNISQRNITVSTCGLIPEIYRLASEKLQINLAISLHAATDEKRRRLMPVAKSHSLHELMKACQYYFKQTGRRITFEYSLIEGVNDTLTDANELKKLMADFQNPFHINLIPVNPVQERSFRATSAKNIHVFKNALEKYQKNVTIRREMGSDINGACGQLRISCDN
jgi:23S rRNA (adenine2503-C2)-methyltransferase